MRTPHAAGDDIAMFTQGATVVLELRPKQFCLLRYLPLHVRQQRVTELDIERSGIGMPGCGARDGDTVAGRGMQADRACGAAEFEIDEMEAIRDQEADRARQPFGDI